jgi:hypothetical protein
VPAELRQLDPNDALQGLTSKQQLFVSYVFSGLSTVQAFIQAGYGEGMTHDSRAKAASALMQEPHVQGKLRELREKRDEQSTLAPFLTREWILNGVAELAREADRDSVRLGAYKLLGQTVGIDLFRETTVVERRQRTPDEIDAELRKRLDELSVTIEGRATERQAPAVEQHKPDRRRKPSR